jgi:hypothetical protein
MFCAKLPKPKLWLSQIETLTVEVKGIGCSSDKRFFEIHLLFLRMTF